VCLQQVDGCLWQGLIAVSPGHPILAQAIETIVNQVRERYSLVNLDSDLCPRPKLFVNRMDRESALTGSCLLAKSVNSALRKHPSEPFSPGVQLVTGNSTRNIPGRVVVLKSNGDDMGGRRLTCTSKNSIVAQVDLPVVDEQTSRGTSGRHGTRYDFSQLYNSHTERVHETIELSVFAHSAVNELPAAII
jgi:hypothetical protein